jgi:hypothetical protein
VLVERGELDAAAGVIRESGVQELPADNAQAFFLLIARAKLRRLQRAHEHALADLTWVGAQAAARDRKLDIGSRHELPRALRGPG